MSARPTTLTLAQARRLALARSGLLKPEWTGFRAGGGSRAATATEGALGVVRRFGYLQLDTVSIAGARSHAIVLLSRLRRFDPALAESLLRPGVPLFEYWGHEASWMPLDLYPAFEFRRREFRDHPWWGDVVGAHPDVARDLLARIRSDGPLRSLDMEGEGSRGWWNLKTARRVASALWSSGELAVRERRGFQRTFDLAERVIPEALRSRPLAKETALETLFLRALEGHGWATTGTIASTWRLRNRREEIQATLRRLRERRRIVPCAVVPDNPSVGARAKPIPGWILPEDLALAARLETARPAAHKGVLLSPFDPLLWERGRVRLLFGFEQVLEIFKPAPNRLYGYYCMPVLAGERLVARVDLKAHRRAGTLQVLSCRYEANGASAARDREAVRSALSRYAGALGLEPIDESSRKIRRGSRQ